MEGTEKNKKYDNNRDEVFSKAVRAGKRTYFFDVKATRAEDYYLTITESKRRFNNETQKFYFEKHKLFLYKEDFEKFTCGLEESIAKIKELKAEQGEEVVEKVPAEFSDVSFDDLGKDTPKEEAPAAEETPVVEEEAPVAEEETPVVEEETPVVEEEAPVAEEETPVVEEETPVVEEEAPVAEEETPKEEGATAE